MKKILALLTIVLILCSTFLIFTLQVKAQETGTSKDPSYVPLGTGVSFTYSNIPFEIRGVLIRVFRTDRGFVPTQSLDLSRYTTEKIHIMVQASFADNVPNGVVVGHINIYYTDNTLTAFDLIMGVNIAEWAYDRPEVQPYLQHTKIPAAYSWWTNEDSSYYYWGHYFYILIDTEEKPLNRLELVLDSASYTSQKYYGYSPADWFEIIIWAITLEVPVPFIIPEFSLAATTITSIATILYLLFRRRLNKTRHSLKLPSPLYLNPPQFLQKTHYADKLNCNNTLNNTFI